MDFMVSPPSAIAAETGLLCAALFIIQCAIMM